MNISKYYRQSSPYLTFCSLRYRQQSWKTTVEYANSRTNWAKGYILCCYIEQCFEFSHVQVPITFIAQTTFLLAVRMCVLAIAIKCSVNLHLQSTVVSFRLSVFCSLIFFICFIIMLSYPKTDLKNFISFVSFILLFIYSSPILTPDMECWYSHYLL